jgi:NAD(P)-dependent dehydrogenase (short-subunit alcohol dehydrogenase family)
MTDLLPKLPDPFTAAVFGASGGIGSALTRALAAHPACGTLLAASRRGEDPTGGAANVVPASFSLEDEASIAAALDQIEGDLHLVIVASGALGDPEKSWKHLDHDRLMAAFEVNTVGPALIAKHALDRLPRKAPGVFAALSARVGSVSDNRLGGWHGYRASKAALNQMIRCLAIELGRKRPQAVCAGLHPGTVDTELSQPFQGNVPDGKLFTPDYSAARLLEVLSGLNPEHTGRCFDWKGEEIAP